ncbi:hypothetical protein PLESTF_001040300 [Pleodorina starrii]|nr:hypothetical protein PLESTM_001114900 [Pleodorina starrii]GLC70856.1 hypothetical protein PLESTF_001040300 [Pleodorina starrii]
MADFASPASNSSLLTCFVDCHEASKCEASTCLADRSRCCSCTVVFGTWQPRELESLLNRPSCSCIADTAANLHLIKQLELDQRDLGSFEEAKETDTYSDDQDEQYTMSYQEWISRRMPIKLPPGLPRPPRHPAPAAEHCSTGTSYDDNDDDDLHDDCDEWYNRNVAAGNFPDWMLQAQHPAPEPSSSSAAATTAAPTAAATTVAASTTVCSIHGHGDDDLEAECDEWFNRNVASGLFSSWTTTGAVSAQSAAPKHPPAAGVDDAAGPAPAAVAEDTPSGVAMALQQQQGPAAARGGLELLAVRGSTNDDDDDAAGDGSLPASPTGSDCRTASDAGCYSGVSSRSCSSLSLGSLEGECSAGSGCEDDEEATSADAASGKTEVVLEAYGERRLGSGCRGWVAEPSAAGGELGLVASALEGAAGAMVRLVDCGGWEAEVEARARQAAGSGGCGGAGRGHVEQEGLEGLCGTWLEAQLSVLLGDVVTGALFC